MSYDAGGHGPVGQPGQPVPPPGYPGYPATGQYPAPGTYPPPGYPAYPPGYAPHGYPQPGYAPTGYAPPSYPPPGYAPPGYPPPGYVPPGHGAPELKPGVIPLRPLSLSEIFNGAVAYIRMNPKATLGLTAAVVVVAQILGLILQFGPLAATGSLGTFGDGEEMSRTAVIGSSLSGLAGAVATGLSAIVLSGLLTVVVGRAVFGAGITIGEAWQRVRGRLLALFAVTVIEAIGAGILIAIGVGVVIGVGYGTDSFGIAFVVGLVLALLLGSLLVYLWTVLSFAPTLIVLERLGVMAAFTRSIALIKNDFWRVLGIRLLGILAAGVIAGAVSIPFSLGGQLTLTGAHSTSTALIALVLISIGSAIGQIITAPFTAGVVVLQYADRRMRAEAFDLVLRSGAAARPDARDDSTDHLWLTPHL